MLEKNIGGHWKVTSIPFASRIDEILSPNFVPEGWLDAEIPEDIHATLKRAGLARGHFMGRNTDEDKWIEDADWVYYKQFYVSAEFMGKKTVLEFDGLDTLCDIYLNGILIGSGRNMFTGLSLDVTRTLRYDKSNVVVIRFYSAVESSKKADTDGLYSSNSYDRLHIRKAQMNYAWDFCGRYVTAGIWKDVRLKAYEHNRIESWYIYTLQLADGKAKLGLEISVSEDVELHEDYVLSVEISDGDRQVYNYKSDIGYFRSSEITIDEPKLWWPRPYGEQPLYDVVVALYKKHEKVDIKKQKFGIRTIQVIQEKQEDGISFIFQVNGKRLFIRGANWVPMDVIYTDITYEDYEKILTYAALGNISMLRVWGGGIYEYDCFYDICDRLGILIYHDFMLACGIYPQNQEFLDNVREEAEFNIKNLRNRTCVAAWCGDNENDIAYGWDMRHYAFINDKLSRGVVQSACKRYDPHRFYLPSSPSSPFVDSKGGDNPNSPYQGDTHVYLFSLFLRDKNYYKKIKDIRPRFISEFGFLSFPEKDTYYKFNYFKIEPEKLEPSFENYPNPQSFAKFSNRHDCKIYYSGVYHSHCLKYWIEYFRALKGVCWGCLYWKFNDSLADNHSDGHNQFPSLMSVVDFYQVPKMAYYYSKRAYENLIIACVEEDGKNLGIYVCNETDSRLYGILRIYHMNFDGCVLWSQSVETNAGEDASTRLLGLSQAELDVANPCAEYIKVAFEFLGQTIENRYFLLELCDYHKLALSPANLSIIEATIEENNEITLKLQTESYARNVRVNILDFYAFYTDNFFDMDAKTQKAIRISPQNAKNLLDKCIYIEAENQKRIVMDICDIEKKTQPEEEMRENGL